ncbi:MAG: hypothetical protein R3E68_20415 [Burkholderiaceae bacterium]
MRPGLVTRECLARGRGIGPIAVGQLSGHLRDERPSVSSPMPHQAVELGDLGQIDGLTGLPAARYS